MRAYWGRYEVGDPAILNAYENLVLNPPPIISLDTETVSLKDTRVIGIGIGTQDYDHFFFSIGEPTLPWHLITNACPQVTKLWANAPFDLEWNTLGKFGVDIDNIEDVQILLRLLNLPAALTDAHWEVRPKTWIIKELLAQYQAKSMLELPINIVAEKCMRDCAVTMELRKKFISDVDFSYYKRECRLLSLLIHNSHRGIALDTEYVDKLEAELDTAERLYVESCKAQGFNPLAPQQVAYMLMSQGVHIPIERRFSKITGEVKYSPDTSEDILQTVSHPWAAATLLARKYNKLHGVVKNMKGFERAHSIFGLDSATARITSKKANRKGYIQQHNLPTGYRPQDIKPKTGPVRRAFKPDKDVFTRFDKSQVELRILAYLSKDKVMLQELNTPGGDIHKRTQLELGIAARVMAKNMNFGTIYGGSVEILSEFTGIKDLALLAYYQQKLAELYPEAWQWIAQQREQGLRDGYVYTLGGRKLSLLNEHSNKQLTDRHIENCAVNYPIQGTAAEMFKGLLLELESIIPIDDFILQIHDEELLDGHHELPGAVYDEEKEVWNITGDLAHLTPIYAPLELNYCERWA